MNTSGILVAVMLLIVQLNVPASVPVSVPAVHSVGQSTWCVVRVPERLLELARAVLTPPKYTTNAIKTGKIKRHRPRREMSFVMLSPSILYEDRRFDVCTH